MMPIHRPSPRPAAMKNLQIDCSSCCGLCCVGLYFSKSEGFPRDKAPGEPCRHLLPDFRCAKHGGLKAAGYHGCMAYDCFGAGQRLTQHIYGGRSWRDPQIDAEQMFSHFQKLYRLHQVLWFLAEAEQLLPAEPLLQAAGSLIEEGLALTRGDPGTLEALDDTGFKRKAVPLLQEAGCLVQKALLGKRVENQQTDYLGQDLRKGNWVAADFSMTLLIAANLRGCDLTGANFLGADLRDTDLRGADLRESIFLTQGQLNAARGDKSTRLPEGRVYPATWL